MITSLIQPSHDEQYVRCIFEHPTLLEPLVASSLIVVESDDPDPSPTTERITSTHPENFTSEIPAIPDDTTGINESGLFSIFARVVKIYNYFCDN